MARKKEGREKEKRAKKRKKSGFNAPPVTVSVKKFRKGQTTHPCGFVKCKELISLSKRYCEKHTKEVKHRQRERAFSLREALAKPTLQEGPPKDTQDSVRLTRGKWNGSRGRS